MNWLSNSGLLAMASSTSLRLTRATRRPAREAGAARRAGPCTSGGGAIRAANRQGLK